MQTCTVQSKDWRLCMHIHLAGEQIVLLPERALFWPAAETLFVADLHLGKDAAFRAVGAPLPGGTTADDLTRLTAALQRTSAKKLVVLGDLRHSRHAQDATLQTRFGEWRRTHQQLDITLIRGNHDASAGDPPAEWNVRCVDAPYAAPPFTLLHEPANLPKTYTLAGHLHPAAVLHGAGRQRLKLPCFWVRAQSTVLPAFSAFTGGAPVQPRAGDQVYVIADDQVLAVR